MFALFGNCKLHTQVYLLKINSTFLLDVSTCHHVTKEDKTNIRMNIEPLIFNMNFLKNQKRNTVLKDTLMRQEKYFVSTNDMMTYQQKQDKI
jgi:hypothetical protein